eukprot:c18804_g1_i2 orf=827-1507(+)
MENDGLADMENDGLADMENNGLPQEKYDASTDNTDARSPEHVEEPHRERRFTVGDPPKELKELDKDHRYEAKDPPNEPSRTSPIRTTRPSSTPSTIVALRRWNHWKIVEAILRITTAIFSLIAFAVMAANHQTGVELGTKITFSAKFSDFQAYSYLLGMNLLTFVYSTVQVVMWGLASKKGYNHSPTFNLALAIFICDEVCYLESVFRTLEFDEKLVFSFTLCQSW